MSRECRDLDSPIEDILIVVSVIVFIALCVFGFRIIGSGVNIFSKSHSDEISRNENSSESIGVDTPDDGQERKAEDDGAGNKDPRISEPAGLEHYEVIHVRDGDTIDIIYHGEKKGLRFIGVNTPESVHPSKPVECFGPESSNYTKSKLQGKEVGVEFDDSQGRYDNTDEQRLLAYVYLDGYNFNQTLIREGYGYEYTYNEPYKYRTQFKEAEASAQIEHRGLWSECADLDVRAYQTALDY